MKRRESPRRAPGSGSPTTDRRWRMRSRPSTPPMAASSALARVLRGAFADGAVVKSARRRGPNRRPVPPDGPRRIETGARWRKAIRSPSGGSIMSRPATSFGDSKAGRPRRRRCAAVAPPQPAHASRFGQGPQGRGSSRRRPGQARRRGPVAVLRAGSGSGRNEAARPGRNASARRARAACRALRRQCRKRTNRASAIAKPSATRFRCAAGTRSSRAATASSATSCSMSRRCRAAKALPSARPSMAAPCRDNYFGAGRGRLQGRAAKRARSAFRWSMWRRP